MSPPDASLAEALAALRRVLDAIPLPIFVVDADVRIHEYNRAAVPLLGPDRSISYRRRGGEVLHCLHSTDRPQGCGAGPHCEGCVIRGSVNRAFKGESVAQERARLELVADGKVNEVFMMVSAAPLEVGGRKFALLTLENAGDLATLESLLPICMGCKRVRRDKGYWQTIEQYLETHLDLDLSHGLCPECMARTKEAWKAAGPRGRR